MLLPLVLFSFSVSLTEGIQAQNREWFTILTSGFTPEMTVKLQQLLQTAEQRESARGRETSEEMCE